MCSGKMSSRRNWTRQHEAKDVFSIKGRGTKRGAKFWNFLWFESFSNEGTRGDERKRSFRSVSNVVYICFHLDGHQKKLNIPSKRPYFFIATTSEKQVEQCVRKLFGLVRREQSAVTSRSTNRHQDSFSSILAFLYSFLDLRASK